jgi:hypothetical protein
MAPCPSSVVSTTDVPVLNVAEAVLPLETFSPAGLDVTLPPLPVAVTVTVAGELAQAAPQVSVPPQPSEIVPQVLFCAAHEVGVHVPDGVTFKIPLTVAPPEALMTAETEPLANAVVVAVKSTKVCPESTVTLAGTCTSELLLVRETGKPLAGAGWLRLTVPVEDAPLVTVDGLNVNDETATAVVPH